MKKIIFSTMIASLLALVGCQSEELVSDNSADDSGKKVILTANIQGSSATRVALTTDTDENENPIVKVKWSASGEKFKVYGYNNEASTFYGTPTWFTQIEGTNQFEGTLPASHNGTYLAVYGDDLPSSDQPLQYFLDEQDGTLYQHNLYYEDEDVSIYKSSVLMLAEFSNTAPSLTFEHQTAILKPTFTVGGTDINNTITQIVMGNVVNPTTENSSTTGITIAPIATPSGEQANQTLGSDIYIHLPVVLDMIDYSEDHTFTFSVTAGVKEYTGSLTIPAGMSIQAGNLYTANIVLTEINPGDELSYDSSTKTFSVSGPKGLQLLNKWMAKQISKDDFLNYKFSGYENAKNVDFNSYSWNISLTENISMPSVGDSESNWIPVPFKGTFDGNNHTIYNLTINNNTATSGNFGLISNLSENTSRGIIQNLTLEDVRVNTITNGSVGAFVGTCSGERRVSITNCHVINGYISGKNTVGGIAGCSPDTEVDIVDCTVSGSVVLDGNDTYSYQYVGGIVGQITSGCIQNCTNNATVKSLAGSVIAGGIVGQYNGTDSGSYNISGCTNSQSATITVVNTYVGSNYVSPNSYVGGIIGNHGNNPKALKVYGCINHAEINFTRVGQYGSHYVGGIIGYFYRIFDLRTSANTGTLNVNITGNNSIYAGGIMGFAGTGNTNEYDKTQIKGCWTKNVVEYYNTVVNSNFDGVGQLNTTYMDYKSSFFAEGETEAEQQSYVNTKVTEMNSIVSGWKWQTNDNGWPTPYKN